MNRVSCVARVTLGIISVAALSSCGGGNGVMTPECVNTSTIACTQSGAVQGVVSGDSRSFLGIPYAAPPVGNLRWRPPAPPLAWQGVRDASSFGNVCPTTDLNGNFLGNEDCLVLNVFTSNPPPQTKQPVMVFFHGGGNVAGSSQGPPLDPPNVQTQGVVVVSAEYRLGVLGFLAIPQLTAEGNGLSGNYALMDMLAVLSWVQMNIAAFGGDPKHVMFFGQSAGAYNIQPLLAAPSAQGLFSVAGMESNVIPAGQLPTLASLEATDEPIVAALGCDTAADVLACLRAVPANTIVDNEGPYPNLPVIAPPFIPVDPFVALQQNGSPVPLLLGSNREEWTEAADNPSTPLTESQYEAALHSRFDSIGPTVAAQVLALYPAADYDTPEYALIAVDSDYNVTCEVRNAARAAAGANGKPIWRYFYTHRFENNAALNAQRAFHGSELYFVFDNLSVIDARYATVTDYVPTAAEITFAGDMMGYWTRFAATGNPNGMGAVAWPTYDPATDSMLQLDDTPVEINGYHNPQCDYLSTLPQP
jgi:para-nitrobenzyl esterase